MARKASPELNARFEWILDQGELECRTYDTAATVDFSLLTADDSDFLLFLFIMNLNQFLSIKYNKNPTNNNNEKTKLLTNTNIEELFGYLNNNNSNERIINQSRHMNLFDQGGSTWRKHSEKMMNILSKLEIPDRSRAPSRASLGRALESGEGVVGLQREESHDDVGSPYAQDPRLQTQQQQDYHLHHHHHHDDSRRRQREEVNGTTTASNNKNTNKNNHEVQNHTILGTRTRNI